MLTIQEFNFPKKNMVHFSKNHIRSLSSSKDGRLVAAGGIDSLYKKCL